MKIVRYAFLAAAVAGLALALQTTDARAEGCGPGTECGGPDGSGGKGAPTGHVVTRGERFRACMNEADVCSDPCWLWGYPGVAVCSSIRGCTAIADACLSEYCGAGAVSECSRYIHDGGTVPQYPPPPSPYTH